MADARVKQVLEAIIDNMSRSAHLFDLITDLGPALGKGDVIEIPQQVAPTNTSATTRAAAQSLTPTVSSLTVDQEVFFNINMPKLAANQLINGRWGQLTGVRASQRGRNVMDDALIANLATVVAWDTSATYHSNVDDGDLADDDLYLAEAQILANDGVMRENLIYVVSPYAEGSFRNIVPSMVPGFIGASGNGDIGLKTLGTVNGIPVVPSTGILRNRTIAVSASTITSNQCACTVAAGHGLVPGMFVTTTGLTTNASTAVAITSVAATTITVPITAANGANGTGNIVSRTSMNLLLDRTCVFGARQILPELREVPDPESAATALQYYAAYGYQGIAGRVRVLHTRGSAL